MFNVGQFWISFVLNHEYDDSFEQGNALKQLYEESARCKGNVICCKMLTFKIYFHF